MRRSRNYNLSVTVVFADGSSMTEEEFMRDGRTIKAVDNQDLLCEVRNAFYPEYAMEERKAQRILSTEKRRQELLAELNKLDALNT